MATIETYDNVGTATTVEHPQSWQIVLILFGITTIIEAIAVSHVFAFLPLYLRLVGLPETSVVRWTGIILSGVFSFGLPLVPFWGAWADKYGRKLIIIRSALVEALVALLVVVSQTPWQLGLSLFVIGFQLGNTGVMLAALRSVTPARRVGFAIALLGIAGPVGSALGPAGGGWLVDHTSIGLRGLFALDALLSVGAALLLAVAYLEVRPSVAPVGSVMGLARQSLVSIVTSPISLVLFGTFSLVLLGRSVVQPFLPLFVERVHPGADGLPSAIGLVVGSSALIGALLSPAAGALGDRFGYRRILVLVTIITAISLAVLPLAPGIATLALATAFVGGGVSAFTTLVYALLATIVPEDRRSATLNLAFFPVYVGAIIGPFIGALVVEIGLPWVPIVGAGFAAAGLILQRRLPRS